MSQIAEFGAADNPYRAPTARQSRNTPDTQLDEHLRELAAFVGPKAGYYFRKWGDRLQDPDAEIGINWAAFFLCGMWFAYRKMYRVTLIYFSVVMLVGMGQWVLFVPLLGMKDTPALVSFIINVCICTICGLYGNVWYLDHAERTIAEAKANGADAEYLMHILVDRGGTSLLTGIGLSFLASFVAGLIMLFLILMTRAI